MARSEHFEVDDAGRLVRCVAPAGGKPYRHSCELDVLRDVAWEIEQSIGPVNLEQLRELTGRPWSQVSTALAFLRERGCVNDASPRIGVVAASSFLYEDAMIEFLALAEGLESAA